MSGKAQAQALFDFRPWESTSSSSYDFLRPLPSTRRTALGRFNKQGALASLPPEIVHHIVSYVRSFETPQMMASLKALSLVSSLWNACSQPHLFRKVVIKIYDYGKFLSIVENRPEVGTWVHAFHPEYLEFGGSMSLVRDVVRRERAERTHCLAARLPNVRQLKFDTSRGSLSNLDQANITAFSSFTAVRDVSFIADSCDLENALKLLVSLPRVSTCSFELRRTSRDTVNVSPQPLQYLRSLSIRGLPKINKVLLEILAPCISQGTLHTLCVEFTEGSSSNTESPWLALNAVLKLWGQSLQTVTITTRNWTQYETLDLRGLKEVTSLTISHHPSSHISMLLLDQLPAPHRLKKLTLSWSDPELGRYEHQRLFRGGMGTEYVKTDKLLTERFPELEQVCIETKAHQPAIETVLEENVKMIFPRLTKAGKIRILPYTYEIPLLPWMVLGKDGSEDETDSEDVDEEEYEDGDEEE